MSESTTRLMQSKPLSRACRFSRMSLEQLQMVKITVIRGDIPQVPNADPNASPPPLLRTLEDPAGLLIHYRPAEEIRCPIFDRDDIVINQEFEDRIICTKATSSKSRSPGKKRSRTRSVSKGRSSGASRRRSPHYESRKYSRNKSRTRSRSPSLRNSKNKIQKYREDSPPSKYSVRYSPPLRPGEYRPPKYSIISRSPGNSRKSPEEPMAGPSKKRSRSPKWKRSVSPYYEGGRRSRSFRDNRSSERYHNSESYYHRSRSPCKDLRRSRTPEKYRRLRKHSPAPSRTAQSQPHFKDGGFYIPEECLQWGMLPGFLGPGLRPRLPFGPPGFNQRPYIPIQDPFMPLMRLRPPIVYNSLYKSQPVTSQVPPTTTNAANAADVATHSSTTSDAATGGVISVKHTNNDNISKEGGSCNEERRVTTLNY